MRRSGKGMSSSAKNTRRQNEKDVGSSDGALHVNAICDNNQDMKNSVTSVASSACDTQETIPAQKSDEEENEDVQSKKPSSKSRRTTTSITRRNNSRKKQQLFKCAQWWPFGSTCFSRFARNASSKEN